MAEHENSLQNGSLREAPALQEQSQSSTLMAAFFASLAGKLAEARRDSATPDEVLQVSAEEALAAIEAKRSWVRPLTHKEEWIIHEYVIFLEDLIEGHRAKLRPQGGAKQWLWRVFNLGFPDGHEDSSNTWGNWLLISAEDAERLAREDAQGRRYEFVPYVPAKPAGAPA